MCSRSPFQNILPPHDCLLTILSPAHCDPQSPPGHPTEPFAFSLPLASLLFLHITCHYIRYLFIDIAVMCPLNVEARTVFCSSLCFVPHCVHSIQVRAWHLKGIQ